MKCNRFPPQQGLYDPAFEHDSCGVGFVGNIRGNASYDIVQQGIKVLKRLAHRGAVGADPQTGDGAGILIQTPHEFFKKVADENEITLPEQGAYGTGLVFFPTKTKERAFCKALCKRIIEEEGQILLGWREVPVDSSEIGRTARNTQPVIEQVFIGSSVSGADQSAFERRLYVARKRVENAVRDAALAQKTFFYITNLSSRTFSYKGLLMPHQLDRFFLDLKDKSIKSSLCLVHSRYSTNTFPTWDLSQPFRFLAHNGEINTLRGNINWMHARQGLLTSGLYGKEIAHLKPVIVPGGSDSAMLDNMFELLVLGGRSLPHAMMMLIPSAWEQAREMSEELKGFYKYHACFMEPWDGPAAIAFTDGIRIGAVLDRNGLRPARYLVTKQDFVVMASEAGVLDIEPANIAVSGRLEPGKLFFIDTGEQRIIHDEEIKRSIATQRPYSVWVKEQLVDMQKLPEANVPSSFSPAEPEDMVTFLQSFGYTREDLKVIVKPMAEQGIEPTGSMGNDTPHAVLSQHPQLLYNYFKQLFAQVTNPAIDPIREEIVMSLYSFIGPKKNILDETPEHAHTLWVQEPVLDDEELEKIRAIQTGGFRTKTISVLFHAARQGGFMERINRVCKEAEQAIREGYTFIILTDRGVDKGNAPLPMLLAAGAVHHHLVRKLMRTRIGIIVESAEPREVHHFALLFGYGADGINPYGAYASVRYLIGEKELGLEERAALKNYRKAVNKGILKILSKMGISTLQSYRGAQIFESLGLHQEVIDRCFTGTASRISGAAFSVIEQETLLRHRSAYPERDVFHAPYLSAGGVYQWKRDGEFHLWNPESIAALQDAARNNDYRRYKEFAQLINDQSKNPATLRGLLTFKAGSGKKKAVPLDTVEPAHSIMKRFSTGAMSFGSISRGAHETLAIAMNRIHGRSNTGEGGEDPARFMPLSNGDSTRSAIKQVASGRFGVTTNYLVNADELQIKIAQGAKPGEGGQLPGHKVSVTIAKTRYTMPGVTLISPPPHHDIYSIEDLAQLIFDLKNTNPQARISVKLVSEIGVGTVAAGVAKGHADMILISGGDGGTGASPVSSIRHAGLPWELGLSETHQTLVLNDLRSRVRLQTDGQMRTGRDVAIAALLGAEEFGFCTSVLVVMGCVMLRHCHLNNCSVGVATQEELLEKRFTGKPEHVMQYFFFVAEELREIMAGLGIRRMDEMIGRTELLEVHRAILPWKAREIDFSKVLYKPGVSRQVHTHCIKAQEHGIDKVLDRKLIKLCKNVFQTRAPVKLEMEIKNVHRTVGAMLSGEVCRRFGEEGLPEDTIHGTFKGIAGQSFGAWLSKGVTFELEGLANDYVGKGVSGGKIIVYPDKGVDYLPEENSLIGNTAFYGAIAGEAYIRGVAGERFCIRNSGLLAVVEGVGDHGCEYMTGGRVVVIGSTGRNFAAGMSGGIAYVYDEEGAFEGRCNKEMAEIEAVQSDDEAMIHRLLQNHYRYTRSTRAKSILDDFGSRMKKFKKVMPIEYKRILGAKADEEKLDLIEMADG